MQRHFRLRQSRDFTRLRQEGRAFHSRWVIVSVMPNGLPHNRYGFVTSKQIGKAVTRNRVRRVMREAVRLFHPQLRPGFDIVLVARPPLVAEPFSRVQRILREAFIRAGVIKIEGGEE